MKRVFLIDLENVHNHGFKGIEMLSSNDRVVVFQSDKCKLLDDAYSWTSAIVELYDTVNGVPNAMDIKILSYMFDSFEPEVEIYIVSNDNGYSKIIKAAESLGIHNVKVIKNIEEAILYERLEDYYAIREFIEKRICYIEDTLNRCPKSETLEEIMQAVNIELPLATINKIKKRIMSSKNCEELKAYFHEVATSGCDSISDNMRISYQKMERIADKVYTARVA